MKLTLGVLIGSAALSLRAAAAPSQLAPQLSFPNPGPPSLGDQPPSNPAFPHHDTISTASDVPPPHTGVGHFSEWAREAKEEFLKDLKNDEAHGWTLVMGNEGGDLDSMVSALAYSYHLTHQVKPIVGCVLAQNDQSWSC